MSDLPQGGTVLTRDTRTIERVSFDDDESSTILVGRNCSKIVAYDEFGVGSLMPWLAIFNDDQIIFRIPAYQVSIAYYENTETSGNGTGKS